MGRPPTSYRGACSGLNLSRRRTLLAGTLAPLTGGGLSACLRRDPLRLAGHPWPGYEPMFLARSLGYLPDGVELQDSATIRESLALTRQGRVDGVMLTLDELLQLRDQGLPLQIVLVFDVSSGADMLLARPGLRHLAALRGRRVGAEPTVLGELLLTMTLEKAGLAARDITLRHIPHDRHIAAWEAGEVDALITYEPVAGQLLARGAQALLSTRQLPDTVFDVLAVLPERASAQAHALRAGLGAHFKALSYLRQNPWDAAYRVAPRLNISAEALIDSLRGLELPDLVGNRNYLASHNSALLQAARRLSPLMQRAGLLRQPVDLRHLLTSAYLPRS